MYTLTTSDCCSCVEPSCSAFQAPATLAAAISWCAPQSLASLLHKLAMTASPILSAARASRTWRMCCSCLGAEQVSQNHTKTNLCRLKEQCLESLTGVCPLVYISVIHCPIHELVGHRHRAVFSRSSNLSRAVRGYVANLQTEQRHAASRVTALQSYETVGSTETISPRYSAPEKWMVPKAGKWTHRISSRFKNGLFL